ncbi:MAG: hypothetical protein QW625_03050 [Candidatus Nanoarchaeia archaeon]
MSESLELEKKLQEYLTIREIKNRFQEQITNIRGDIYEKEKALISNYAGLKKLLDEISTEKTANILEQEISNFIIYYLNWRINIGVDCKINKFLSPEELLKYKSNTGMGLIIETIEQSSKNIQALTENIAEKKLMEKIENPLTAIYLYVMLAGAPQASIFSKLEEFATNQSFVAEHPEHTACFAEIRKCASKIKEIVNKEYAKVYDSLIDKAKKFYGENADVVIEMQLKPIMEKFKPQIEKEEKKEEKGTPIYA